VVLDARQVRIPCIAAFIENRPVQHPSNNWALAMAMTARRPSVPRSCVGLLELW